MTEASFEEFVRTTAPSLMRTATLLCGDRDAGEDLLQATYARAFSRWRMVRQAENPMAYTRRIMTRTLVSQRRRRSSSELPVADVPDRPQAGADPTLRLSLLEALAMLPPKDRAVLVLRFWEDRSVAETAAELGISENACRTRTSRALTRLRVHFPALEES